MGKKLLTLVLSLLLLTVFTRHTFAQSSQVTPPQEERLEAVVTKVVDEKEIEVTGKKQLYQKLELLITSSRRKGEKIIIENGDLPLINLRSYEVGDKLVVSASENFERKKVYYIQDYIRRDALYWLFGIFIALTVLIGGRRGVASIVGMIFSFVIIFSFVLPKISHGNDPILIAILASLLIIPVTFYLSHGVNKKTTTAIAGTVIALIFTGFLANLFVDAARLTGFASEEAAFLQVATGGAVNIRGLLLAGIIISVLGILDDITISQAAIVQQLKKTSPKLRFTELYTKAMDVGKDHIASVVNTLILVYTGAAMPLLLLFLSNSLSFSEVINYELLAEEIVRTLVASIGLILAVPITTAITSYVVGRAHEK